LTPEIEFDILMLIRGLNNGINIGHQLQGNAGIISPQGGMI
jgi:hypothetical protein